ncbi:MFS transporter [Membranihabitans maritimus]|uniref:MFS transporter n=1 Tax=Membranihabitans maritimus TaxID=2904244 RepID=UPI001F0024A0|nr:MFS transporter [Membranihabitans maritimus]
MKRSNFVVGVILVIWFVISFVTNILGPLMPLIIDTYDISLTMASFLPFSFFLAYGIASIPAGTMIERLGVKRSVLIAFSLNLIGTLAFSFLPFYGMALFSLFVIGIGMAMLQVIINPLMRTAGGEENFAFFAVMAQLVFGLASFASPFVFTYFMSSLGPETGENWVKGIFAPLIRQEINWTSLYWLFGIVFIAMIVMLSLIKLPKVTLKEDEKTGSLAVYLELLKDPKVWMYFMGIVAYVGTEQALANWMSEFLKTYHGFSPEVNGAKAVGWFWGSMSIGCVVGLIVLRIFDAKIVLSIATVLSALTLGLAIFGSANVSLFCFPAMGFFISVMFSIIFSMALNSVTAHHGPLSGILCTGIFGGALVPFVVGGIGDLIGLKLAFLFLYITLGYIAFISFKADPIIKNKTIRN